MSTTERPNPFNVDVDIVDRLAALVGKYPDMDNPDVAYVLGGATGEITRLRIYATDLIDRLEKAEAELQRMAETSGTERYERQRLRAKAEGVALALSYAREYQR